MKFVSTRGGAAVALSQAIRSGAAPDGGLYVPDAIPLADLDPSLPLPDFAARFLAPLFAGDLLEADLAAICAEALAIDVPLVTPDPARPALQALELFHGPTAAFKDFGARFLLACFDRLGDPVEPLTVLVATSGDTGGAVGCAAEERAAVRAVILYPIGRVSPFQELQLTCWNDPVRALEVDGDFDDCQRMAKTAFADPALSTRHRLTSANSINIGRLLPQAAYIAHAAARTKAAHGIDPGFIMPTGNLGHGYAVLLAKAMGAPIGPLVLATNANATLADWQASGTYEPRPSVATLANAMDVGAPSNFERLVRIAPGDRELRVELVDDAAIRARITADFKASGYAWCPHSATAAEAYTRLSDAEQRERPWIAAATAHPFKFAEVVEPLIGRAIEPPPALAAIDGRATRKVAIPATDAALTDALNGMLVQA